MPRQTRACLRVHVERRHPQRLKLMHLFGKLGNRHHMAAQTRITDLLRRLHIAVMAGHGQHDQLLAVGRLDGVPEIGVGRIAHLHIAP